MAKGESMTTRQEEVLNLSALYLHIYDKLYFSLMTLSRYFSGYKGGGSKREWSAPYPPPPVSFCVSYDVWFCLFTFHVFLTYRCSCGTMKTEFYVQPEFFFYFQRLSYLSQSFLGLVGNRSLFITREVPLLWIRFVVDRHRL